VLVGATAVLIRGASGSGKSRLAFDLIAAGRRGEIPFSRLVADDRTLVEATHGRLLARPVPALAGLLELRHIGIRPFPYEPMAVVGLVVDLDPAADRLPDPAAATTEIEGISLPCLRIPAHEQAFSVVFSEIARRAVAGTRP
jgi:serine kinase of HPr protein (carbohydrate metabolism regulator)